MLRLFGLEFNEGLKKIGHVCPTGQNDQFLLVALKRQGEKGRGSGLVLCAKAKGKACPHPHDPCALNVSQI
jgi:hypothetical protein